MLTEAWHWSIFSSHPGVSGLWKQVNCELPLALSAAVLAR
jgi:hypothetical protein